MTYLNDLTQIFEELGNGKTISEAMKSSDMKPRLRKLLEEAKKIHKTKMEFDDKDEEKKFKDEMFWVIDKLERALISL